MTLIPADVAFRPELLDGITEGLEVTFPPNLTPSSQALLARLGVRVRFSLDPNVADAARTVLTTQNTARGRDRW